VWFDDRGEQFWFPHLVEPAWLLDPHLARASPSREHSMPVDRRSQTLLAVAELIEETIERLDADGIASESRRGRA
jgi:hypothetical protein